MMRLRVRPRLRPTRSRCSGTRIVAAAQPDQRHPEGIETGRPHEWCDSVDEFVQQLEGRIRLVVIAEVSAVADAQPPSG